jgi:prepilin-type N-terminal cleavage/methylation domain-containing protein
MQTMKKAGGFSIFELLIVIAVIAVVSAIVTPNIISWRSGAKLRGAAVNLKGDLEMAKIRAVRENAFVAIRFFVVENRYDVFVDNGENPADWNLDPDEKRLRTRKLPAGVKIVSTTFTNDHTRFSGRGRADNGTAVLVNTKGEQRDVIISPVGRIWVNRIN